jgi:hypothetical protein
MVGEAALKQHTDPVVTGEIGAATSVTYSAVRIWLR